ncbi:nicotinate (nicotinamide) nucleotide adenylyltransferase [Leptolyngbya sp. NK1-12]|uniref:Probable nicotinate-nucleotide adenylyltransferase n=1 Tax=Leptolyngbya sp. NK1-12 TaxID=2547451 RepID=A0AA96WB33_9CYAN|nr:nicotinate (nicotinamide) nucleotide adenylyltransferase [Leptolyngbya sp. NK1-12]WNZ21769.1 nicotinate (nicotinamide) nucleotide adenylyltransferase [Leptolyngbya sp. NK1-12]
MQKIAIFGGTFNPIHWGHLLMAETALSQIELDRIIWVPTYHPPHKLNAEMLLSYDHRLEMVQLALDQHPNFEVSQIEEVEQEQSSKSYAVDTWRRLQLLYPDALWYWIIGLDAFQSLPRWYGQRELAQHCRWLVAPRLDANLLTAGSSPADGVESIAIKSTETVCARVADALATLSIQMHWQVLPMPLVEISSSLIRRYCRQQRSIRYLVPESVRLYILQHQLYAEASDPHS